MTAQSDAELFCQLHKLITGQRAVEDTAEPGRERRRGDRLAYDCRQLLAWFDGERPPKQAEFQFVRCRDLSPRGFAFYSDAPPRKVRMIIALGAAPFTFFEAETVRCETQHGERGTRYLIGCRFVRRWGG